MTKFDGTFTFNKDNWSGEEASITVRNGAFEINGETLKLEEQASIKDEDGDTRWDFHSIGVKWNDDEFCVISRFECDDYWACEKSEISRIHANPAVLAAIMACNLI